MIATIDAVSESKKGFKVGEKWYNRGKDFKGDFSNLHKGTIIDFDPVDDKWVMSLKITGEQSNGNGVVPLDKESKIIRGNAANAAFAPVFSHFAKDMSPEEAVARTLAVVDTLAQYLTSGLPK